MNEVRAQVVTDLERAVVGYIVNSGLSSRAQASIAVVQDQLNTVFPGAIWTAPPQTLHITLMDWLAPLVEYGGRDKDELFRAIEAEYMTTLADILRGQSPIRITFDTVEVHPAAIIVKGHDDGSYQRIRERFLKKVSLLPETKQPPKIVHATIGKFVEDIRLEDAKHALRGESISFEEEISDFRLVRESTIFMQEYEVLRRFKLRR